MSATTILEGKKAASPYAKWRKELQEATEGNFLTKLFKSGTLKKEVAQLGLALLGSDKVYQSRTLSMGSEEGNKFAELVKSDTWEDPNYYQLLIYFFGEENAKYVKYAWELMPYKMYQHGYSRRSFRAPNHAYYPLLNQINLLLAILEHPKEYNYQKSSYQYYDLTLEEQVLYGTDIQMGEYRFLLWSAAIDLGDQKLYQLMEDIIFNKHPVGKVSRPLIKALLNSEKKECWQLVEKLLLAAQRQEGLRQTILESLDETSIGALQYMVDVMLEHKLSRFSSVVRAVDTWAGLGWEAEKESTVNSILRFAQAFFKDPASIPAASKSTNNMEAYMALWVQGVLDVEKTAPLLHDLLEKGSIEKKSVALKFALEIDDPFIQMPLFYKALEQDNLQVLALALCGMKNLLQYNVESKYYLNNPDFPEFFHKVYQLSQSIQVKEKLFEGKVFSWFNIKFERDDLYYCCIYLMGEDQQKLETVLQHFEELSLNLRETVARTIFKDFYSYSYYYANEKPKSTTVSDFQRQFALRVLKDRGEAIVSSAIKTLSYVRLREEELSVFEEMLKRKSATLRKNLINLLLKQDNTLLLPFVSSLAEKGDSEQRLASLDTMLQLRNEKRVAEKDVQVWANSFREKHKISEKEEQFLEQLQPNASKQVLSAENGYGLYDPQNKSAYALPKVSADSYYKKATAKDPYGFSKDVPYIKKQLQQLYALYQQHKEYEYQVEDHDGTKSKVLLGNNFRMIFYKHAHFTELQKFENYPLHEVWEKWFLDSKLEPRDLFLLTFVSNCDMKKWRDILEKDVFYYQDFIAEVSNGNKNRFYDWNNPTIIVLRALQHKYAFQERTDFLIDATSQLFGRLQDEVLKFKQKKDNNGWSSHNTEYGDGWQSIQHFQVFLNAIHQESLSEEQLKKLWNIYRWRQFSGLPENVGLSLPPLYIYLRMYALKAITQDEMYEGILVPERIHVLTGEQKHYKYADSENYGEQFPFLKDMLTRMRESFLDVELKRGDVNTPVTAFVQSLQKLYGANRFVQMLEGLGKGNLYKGYIYSWSYVDLDKQKLFSFLLKKCLPSESDSQELFDSLIKKAKISEIRLIQAAVYAPQWQKFISQHLGWKGLDAAIWWMHAHTKTGGYNAQGAEFESEVAKYSSVDLQEFKDGAVDKDWFQKAYKELGKAKWEMLYDSAKYISDGNGHRRARLYSDVLTGDLKITEVTAKVKDKRDQDYLRVYGLVPLSKTNPEKDVLTRYEYLLKFKKESKEFGSMKQTSEALAIRVAMENLARNAGYPDPIRLTWAMETKQVQQILSKNTQVEIDGTTVGLVIEEDGKAEVVAYKDGKELKAIPASLKKDPKVLELGNDRKIMREQWSRSRKALEEAMVRGDEFSWGEVLNLFAHPVISKHVEKLVFISSDDRSGFYHNESLITASGEVLSGLEEKTFRIAHCTDLHKEKTWIDYQHYAFDNGLKQPFKQIFRELYLPTPDELEEKAISRRYAGHQVHPKQTLALLKTRGWKVDYEEGLQKVYHKEGFQVKLYAMADWFSPSDVESPTLETIEFHSLKDYKNVPFEDIQPRLFSEVMRDIDLVVSVAHVGGVDPEASQSSLEMRAVLVKETARLFKLANVNINGSHVMVKGSMAEYSVHLGSAVVHQVGGSYLSILPVHSQHRGRLFLPFADEDPKSAEVIAKVLLLAKDKEIQDPTILRQIDRKVEA